jgi:hypothetical protein
LNGLPAPQMYLRVLVADRTPEATGAYRSAVNQRITKAEDLGFALRIRGGDATQSALHHRMSLRATEDQMPPIATELSDATGIAAIDAWIATLPAPTP